uniref:Uncharacterized protein n=1 Tax=Arundo donax TaxID=35708 RepID=A0A0A8Y1T8_ARUDO
MRLHYDKDDFEVTFQFSRLMLCRSIACGRWKTSRRLVYFRCMFIFD